LVCLANLEILNALFIADKMLNELAISQMKIFLTDKRMRLLEE
jgi:hypothetical protein